VRNSGDGICPGELAFWKLQAASPEIMVELGLAIKETDRERDKAH
jgi:hypothetical protein